MKSLSNRAPRPYTAPMPRRSALRLAVAATVLALPAWALADPGYYLVTVYENEGEASVDFRYWTVRQPGEPLTVWPEVGVGYGVTKRWYTEVFLSAIGPTFTNTSASSLNWQNDYLLTQGQYPFDLAIHTNLVQNREGRSGTVLEFGPVLQTDVGRTQLNANLIFERTLRADVPRNTKLKYQWQAKYRWRPALHFGVQGFGELGDWDHWAPGSQQSHRLGPMIAGTFRLGDGHALKYTAAYLVGSVYGSRGDMLSVRLQYLF